MAQTKIEQHKPINIRHIMGKHSAKAAVVKSFKIELNKLAHISIHKVPEDI